MTQGKLFNTKTGIMQNPEGHYDCSISGFVSDANIFNFTPSFYGLQVENGDFYTNTSYDDFISRLVQ